MKKAITLAKRINKITNTNVFENTRKRKVVDARSLLTFILYNYHNMTLQSIADFLESNGKSSDHSTVLYSINSFQTNKRYNIKLEEWLKLLTTKKENKNKAKREFLKLKANHLNIKNINKIVDVIDNLEKEQLADESS
tara:strand:+ start:94 stop:507 length:414 start_codon:yes stop_codon:yes gene_type:complete